MKTVFYATLAAAFMTTAAFAQTSMDKMQNEKMMQKDMTTQKGPSASDTGDNLKNQKTKSMPKGTVGSTKMQREKDMKIEDVNKQKNPTSTPSNSSGAATGAQGSGTVK